MNTYLIDTFTMRKPLLKQNNTWRANIMQFLKCLNKSSSRNWSQQWQKQSALCSNHTWKNWLEPVLFLAGLWRTLIVRTTYCKLNIDHCIITFPQKLNPQLATKSTQSVDIQSQYLCFYPTNLRGWVVSHVKKYLKIWKPYINIYI